MQSHSTDNRYKFTRLAGGAAAMPLLNGADREGVKSKHAAKVVKLFAKAPQLQRAGRVDNTANWQLTTYC